MKNSFFRNLCFGLLSATLLPALASAQEGKATLAVSSIKPTSSLAASVKPDKKIEMGRIIESLDSQLIASISATRKFDVVGRSDLADVIKEQDLGASGNVDAKTAAQAGKLAGAKYLLVTTVDDFQDYMEKATFEGTGRSATKRVFRLSVVGKVYDSSTGKLMESVNFQTGNDAFKQIQEERSYVVKDGELSEEMMVAVARDLAQKIANRIADVIFPAKVLLKRDKEVTINRGEGGGVAVGDTFNVYALGEELIDPDTKESLGREEAKVGRVKITQVNPKTSTAEILDDTGIDKGAILRKPQ
ncbi:MAG: CsgG/HfaB family protein [Verrucomicrobiota bacterium]|jgi:curli biogenesis system outer membrane secretion channel CsgG